MEKDSSNNIMKHIVGYTALVGFSLICLAKALSTPPVVKITHNQPPIYITNKIVTKNPLITNAQPLPEFLMPQNEPVVLNWFKNKDNSPKFDWKEVAYKRMLKYGRGNKKNYKKYLESVEFAAKKHNFHPLLICALCERETDWRNGIFDNGHGHGLMQIDDRYHSAWLKKNYWGNSKKNLDYCVSNIKDYTYNYFNGNYMLGIAAYNGGPTGVKRALKKGKPADYATTQKNYSKDVIRRAKEMGWDGNFNYPQPKKKANKAYYASL